MKTFYTLLLRIVLPLVLVRLWWRGRDEPGYRRNVAERFGFYGDAPSRPVLWLHAVSLEIGRAHV